MEEVDSVSAQANVAYYISMALKKELSWSALSIVFDGFKLTNEQYKNVVKLLLKELQQLQVQLQAKETEILDTEFQNEVPENQMPEVPIQKAKIETDDDNRYILGDHGNDVSECDVEDVKIELPDVVNSFAEINQPVHIRLIDNKNDSIIGENTATRSENEGRQSNENVKSDGPISNKELQSAKKHEIIHTTLFECTFCQKKLSTSTVLRRHERIHTGEKPHQCKTCSKSFWQKEQLKGHEYTHMEESPFKCETCHKSFGNKQNLKIHERIHTGESPFKCKICPKTFRQNAHLKIHVTSNHENIEGKKFQCDICKKSFNHKKSLKFHKMDHTVDNGGKPFECKTCSKFFVLYTTFKNHEKIHKK